MADERWKYLVFNKSISEEESLDFYTTWAKDVSTKCGRVVRYFESEAKTMYNL